jgi:hypothetical protein
VLREWAGATADLRQRFAREARAVSSLNHPRCTFYDVGQHVTGCVSSRAIRVSRQQRHLACALAR